MKTVTRGRWVRLRDGTVGLVRQVWDDGTCDIGVRGQPRRDDVPLGEIVCYVEERSVWVDVCCVEERTVWVDVPTQE